MLNIDFVDFKMYMVDNFGVVIEDVVCECGVMLCVVIEVLFVEMVWIGCGEYFVVVMQDIVVWGEVMLIVYMDDVIFEFIGVIFIGEIGCGYFNLMQLKGLYGYFCYECCVGVVFVEWLFMGKIFVFVVLVNVDGGIMFKVFVGCDEMRVLWVD